MIKVIVCFCAAIIALAIPSICVCSFILGWGYFAQAMLVIATIFDGVLIAYLMNCGVDNE